MHHEGKAASLLCDRLRQGRLTAIDRSVVRPTALADADFDADSFDRALAVHVNLFWLGPASELAVLRRILRPNGLLFLVYQPPAASGIAQVAGVCSRFLRAHGFVRLRVAVEDLRPTPAVCISARVGGA